MALENPHFQLPMRSNGTSYAQIEQDTSEEVAQCLRSLVATRVGSRADLPQMGMPQTLFTQEVNLDEIERQIAEHEPRAPALAAERRDLFDSALSIIGVGADD